MVVDVGAARAVSGGKRGESPPSSCQQWTGKFILSVKLFGRSGYPLGGTRHGKDNPEREHTHGEVDASELLFGYPENETPGSLPATVGDDGGGSIRQVCLIRGQHW